MAQRVTVKQLEVMVARLNRKHGYAIEGYSRDANGKFAVNIGCYVLSGAYGGYKIQQLVTEGGGVRSCSGFGYGTKRECYTWLQGALYED